jgi:hypothetical protein
MDLTQIVFAVNALWFTAAFVQFSIAQSNTVKILVPREARDNPLVPTLSAGVAFLGGMNLAVAAFAWYLATGPAAFANPAAQSVLLVFLGLVNFSQFYFNLPILLNGERRGVAYWPVLKGPMLFIFTVDGSLTVLDFAWAYWL